MHYGKRLKAVGAATCALALFALVAVVGTAGQAWAQACGGSLQPEIQFPAGTPNNGPFAVGTTVTVSNTILNTNATSFTVTDFIQKLSCKDTTNFFLCTGAAFPDDSVVSFQNNVTTTCGVTWNEDTSVAGQITLTPATTLTLASGASCKVAFDVKIEALSTDTTPGLIQWANDYDGTCPGPISGGAQGSGVFSVLECSVEVDKQVSCDGGTTWYDVTGDDDTEPPSQTLSDLCIGFNAFNGTPATDIMIRYKAKNTGSVDATCQTSDPRNEGTEGLFDTNLVILPAGVSTNVPASQTNFAEITTVTRACSEDLVAGEPDTATLLCQCTSGTQTFLADPSTDSAKFACVTPGLGVSKTCEPADANGDAAVVIAYESSGTADLNNCKLTDIVYAGPCDANGDPTTSTIVDTVTTDQSVSDPTSSPTEVDLTANGLTSGTCNGSDCCNQVTVTCDVAGSPGPETITASAGDNCEIQEGDCYTRTPGYWGTHPDAQNFLYTNFGDIPSCGVDLDTSLANKQGSGTEDICSIGGGKKNPPQTDISNTQRQLERQCAAANMNLAASALKEVSCEGALPGITAAIDFCCNAEDSVCNTGPTSFDTACIGVLDFFNNATFGPADQTNLVQGPADSSQCQASKKSGFVNSRPRP